MNFPKGIQFLPYVAPSVGGRRVVLWFVGDSRLATTTGTPSGATAVAPYFVWRRLGGSQFGVLKNIAVSGSRTQDAIDAFATHISTLDPNDYNIFIILSCWNDMMNLQLDTPPLLSPAQCHTKMLTLVALALATGPHVKVYCLTQPSSDGPASSPLSPPSYNGEDWDGVGGLRDQLDTLLLADAAGHNYTPINIKLITGLGPDDSCLNGLNTTFVDEVHPSGGEYQGDVAISGVLQGNSTAETGEGLLTSAIVAQLRADFGF